MELAEFKSSVEEDDEEEDEEDMLGASATISWVNLGSNRVD